MATLRELIIKVSANSQSFQTEIQRASRMGQNYYKSMQDGGRKAASASRETQQALAAVTSQLSDAKNVALSMGGTLAGAFATGHLISLADQWNSVNARLKQASTSTDDFTVAQRTLMEISQRTGTSFSDNAGLFSRSAASMREFGYSSNDVLKVTEALSTGLKLSGASTAEAGSVITQFSQALAQGVLRGEEFNSVNENGDRIIRALAAGMGVARKDLKSMADNGLLTIDRVVPAIMSQLQAMQGEFEAMPKTVSGSMEKVNNSFMQWVGGTNEAYGASATLAGGLESLADNIDGVANAAGILIAVGVSRFMGNWTQQIKTQTEALIDARTQEIAHTAAKIEGANAAIAQIASEKSLLVTSQQSLVAQLELAKTEKQRTSIRALLSKNSADMVKINRAETATINELSIANQKLNGLTSVTRTAWTGVSSLFGGIPGILMLGAGAWYTWYQNQEQARQSAIQYASTLDDVVEKAKTMSTIQLTGSISDSGDSIDALKDKIEGLKKEQAAAAAEVQQYTTLAHQLGVENDRNNGYVQNAEKYQRIYNKLARDIADTTSQLNSVVDNQNKLQKELEEKVNASAAAFRRIKDDITGAINVSDAMAVSLSTTIQFMEELKRKNESGSSQPQQANAAYEKFIQQQKESIALSQKEGVERAKLKALQDAMKQGAIRTDNSGNILPGQDAAIATIQNNAAADFNLQESHKKPRGKSDAEKTEDAYARIIKQQQEQISLSGQNTELAKIKYQVSQGELSTLSDAKKVELMRNAAALDHVNAVEKLKSLNEQLLTPEEALLKTTRERIKLLKEAAPATEEYKDMMERISKASVQDAPTFAGIDASVGGPTGELVKTAEAEKELEKWYSKQLEIQKKFLDEKEINEKIYSDRVAEINKTHNQKLSDIQDAYKVSALASFSEVAGSATDMARQIYGESSAAYKTLFLAQKAFAVASIIMNAHIAAAKAPAELTILGGIPVGSALLASGYASAAMVGGMALAGMAHDGIDRVPETGTWLLQKGERVVTASTSAKLDSTLEKVQQVRQGQQSIGDVNVSYNLTGKPDDTMLMAMDAHGRRLAKQIKKELTGDVIKPASEFGRALHGYYSRTRKE